MNRIFFTSVALFLLSIFIVGQNLDKPFWGIHDWNGARYGNLAKNILRYFPVSGIAQVEYQKPDGGFVLNTHYPPLLPLMLAGSYKIFGVSEWTTRMVPLLFTSIMISGIFLLGYFLFNYSIGLVAALLALATPMVRYFGKNPVHEPIVASFVVIAFLGYVLWKKNLVKSGLLILFGATFFACLTTWSGFFAAFWVAILFRQEKRIFTAYCLMVAALFASHFLFVYLSTGSFLGGELKEIFLYRAGQTPQEYNLIQFISRIRLWMTILFTFSLMLSILLVLPYVVHLKGKWILAGLGFFGLCYPLLFHNAAYIHNYFIFSLVPFISLVSSIGLYYFAKARFANLYLPMACALVLSVFIEKQNFVKALEASSSDKFSVEVATAIKNTSKPDDIVLVMPESVRFASEKFLLFYSDRRIYFSDVPAGPYNVIVRIDQDKKTMDILY